MRSRWLVYRLNTLILIILIQQPEPSGSEAGESWVRNRVREILPTIGYRKDGVYYENEISLPWAGCAKEEQRSVINY
jgi:hypothetical protein